MPADCLSLQTRSKITSETWWTRFFKTKTRLSGSDSPTSTILKRPCIDCPNITRMPCVRPMTASLVATMPHKRHNWKYPLRNWPKTIKDIDNVKKQLTKRLHRHLYRFRNDQISEFTRTYLPPMITADSNKKFVLCITNAFTKYAVVTAIANKDAETVADALYKEWFSKFDIPAQTHTDGSKEFVNKLSADLFQLLNVSHTKMSPAHPQYNA